MKRYILAISGASGPIIGLQVLKNLSKTAEVYLVISSNSFQIIKEETGFDWFSSKSKEIEKKIREYADSDRIYYYADSDLTAPISSGSFLTSGMLVVPCSMKTLASIANGYASNLIERAADVTIKEGRPLLLSPREMPLSSIHLENMLKLARLGVKIVPPIPAFYHKPESVDDVVNFIAGKILDSFGIEHELFQRWHGRQKGFWV